MAAPAARTASSRARWLESRRAGELTVEIRVRGLKGGHSGLDIQRNRGNAIRLLSRVLLRLERDGVAWRLVELQGGSKRNAIPREATARLRVRGEMAAGAGPVDRLSR